MLSKLRLIVSLLRKMETLKRLLKDFARHVGEGEVPGDIGLIF